jgi:hypothetical protein
MVAQPPASRRSAPHIQTTSRPRQLSTRRA